MRLRSSFHKIKQQNNVDYRDIVQLLVNLLLVEHMHPSKMIIATANNVVAQSIPGAKFAGRDNHIKEHSLDINRLISNTPEQTYADRTISHPPQADLPDMKSKPPKSNVYKATFNRSLVLLNLINFLLLVFSSLRATP